MMLHQSIQLGGGYWNKLLCIPVDSDNNIYVYQMTELAIQKLERFPNKIEFFWSIHMVANGEIGQTPTRFDNVIDNIFKVVCVINVQKENKFRLAIYDPTQFQPIRGHPSMVSPCVIPCYNITPIKNSVRAQDDNFSGFNRLLETVTNNSLIITS